MTYYVAVEENDTLTVVDETDTLFEALCHFNTYTDGYFPGADEVEIGKYVDDEMQPIDWNTFE